MGKAQDIREANDQVEHETWQCLTCSAEAQENSKHCMHCEMYWEDVDSGMFDDEDDICECEYEDYDVIEGTATCYKCWSKRHVSSEEWRRIEKAQAEYDLMCEEWDKEQPVASDEPVGDGIPF